MSLRDLRSECKDARAEFLEIERGNKHGYSGEDFIHRYNDYMDQVYEPYSHNLTSSWIEEKDGNGDEPPSEYHLPEMAAAAGLNASNDSIAATESIHTISRDSVEAVADENFAERNHRRAPRRISHTNIGESWETMSDEMFMPPSAGNDQSPTKSVNVYFSTDKRNYTKVLLRAYGTLDFGFSQDFYLEFLKEYGAPVTWHQLNTEINYRCDPRVVNLFEKLGAEKSSRRGIILEIKYVRTSMLSYMFFVRYIAHDIIDFDFNSEYRKVLDDIMKNERLMFCHYTKYQELKKLEKAYRDNYNICVL